MEVIYRDASMDKESEVLHPSQDGMTDAAANSGFFDDEDVMPIAKSLWD